MKLLADENCQRAIVRGVLQRSSNTDFIRAQEVGLSGWSDPDVLAWAAENDRIVATHDKATFRDFAYERVAAGLYMPGVLLISDRLPVRTAIDELLIVVECSDKEEWENRAVFIPQYA